MFKTKWRIVKDEHAGFEVQKKVWWWPFWYQPVINTSYTLERAKEKLAIYKREVVYEE